MITKKYCEEDGSITKRKGTCSDIYRIYDTDNKVEIEIKNQKRIIKIILCVVVVAFIVVIISCFLFFKMILSFIVTT